MDVLAILPDWAPTVLTVGLAIVGGASVILKAVAPLTENKWDDKAAGLLPKLHALLSKIALK